MIMPTSVLVVEQIDDGYHLSVLIVNVKSRPTEDLGLVMMTGSLLLVQNVDGVSQGQTFVIRFKKCNMKCPNCKETDHEPSAKYCHVCGSLIALEARGYEQLIQKALEQSDRIEKELDDLEEMIKVSQKRRHEQKSELQEAMDELARLQKELDDLKGLN